MAKTRPYRAQDQENATEPPPKSVRRIAAKNQKLRDRLSNPMNRYGERPIDKIREEQLTARREYGQWHPPAFVKREAQRDGRPLPLKRCDDCKAGRHHKRGQFGCRCVCP